MPSHTPEGSANHGPVQGSPSHHGSAQGTRPHHKSAQGSHPHHKPPQGSQSKPGFGLFYVPACDPEKSETYALQLKKIEEQVVFADKHGWQNAWFAEHHGSLYGGLINAPDTLCAYLAARTRQIRLGPAICVLPLHDPRHLAERYALVDQLSDGRLDMGLGRGFLASEFELFGIRAEDSKKRFKEAHTVLLNAWQQNNIRQDIEGQNNGRHHIEGQNNERHNNEQHNNGHQNNGHPIDFSGEYYHYQSAHIYPNCKQEPHAPIWVAASNTRESFELAGHYGHHLMINPYTRTPEEIQQGLDYYFAALKDAGIPRSKVRIAAMQHLYCGQIDEEIRQAFNHYLHALTSAAEKQAEKHNTTGSHKNFASITLENLSPDKVLFGPPSELLSRIKKWTQRGITDFCLMPQFGNLSWESSMRSIQLFTREVMPHIWNEIGQTHSQIIHSPHVQQ